MNSPARLSLFATAAIILALPAPAHSQSTWQEELGAAIRAGEDAEIDLSELAGQPEGMVKAEMGKDGEGDIYLELPASLAPSFPEIEEVLRGISSELNHTVIGPRARVYVAETLLEIRPPAAQSGNYEWFLETQNHIIHSGAVLIPVIENLGLLDRWKAEGQPMRLKVAIPYLRESLRFLREENSYLVRVHFHDSDPQLAADIANEVVRSYVTYVQTRAAEDLERKLAALQRKADEAAKAVNQAERKLRKLREDSSLRDEVNKEIARLRAEIASLEAQLQVFPEHDTLTTGRILLQMLKNETLKESISDYEKGAQLIRELEVQGLGDAHPQMQAAKAEQAERISLIDEELRAIEKALKLKLKVQRQSLNSLGASNTLPPELVEAEREFSLAQATFETAKQDLAEARTILVSDLAPQVTMHEKALGDDVDFYSYHLERK